MLHFPAVFPWSKRCLEKSVHLHRRWTLTIGQNHGPPVVPSMAGVIWDELMNIHWLVLWNICDLNVPWYLGIICYLVGGLEHLDHFSIYWECHHPNWRTHLFQRGRSATTQLWTLGCHRGDPTLRQGPVFWALGARPFHEACLGDELRVKLEDCETARIFGEMNLL